MAIPERRGPFTADEFASIPDDETRHELVAGRIHSEPLPVPRHDRIRRRLAVEILSPSNRPGAVRAKVTEVLAAGARLVWVVDPESRTVVAYRSTRAARRFAPDGTVDGDEVLPGLSFPVAAVFGEGPDG